MGKIAQKKNRLSYKIVAISSYEVCINTFNCDPSNTSDYDLSKIRSSTEYLVYRVSLRSLLFLCGLSPFSPMQMVSLSIVQALTKLLPNDLGSSAAYAFSFLCNGLCGLAVQGFTTIGLKKLCSGIASLKCVDDSIKLHLQVVIVAFADELALSMVSHVKEYRVSNSLLPNSSFFRPIIFGYFGDNPQEKDTPLLTCEAATTIAASKLLPESAKETPLLSCLRQELNLVARNESTILGKEILWLNQKNNEFCTVVPKEIKSGEPFVCFDSVINDPKAVIDYIHNGEFRKWIEQIDIRSGSNLQKDLYHLGKEWLDADMTSLPSEFQALARQLKTAAKCLEYPITSFKLEKKGSIPIMPHIHGTLMEDYYSGLIYAISLSSNDQSTMLLPFETPIVIQQENPYQIAFGVSKNCLPSPFLQLPVNRVCVFYGRHPHSGPHTSIEGNRVSISLFSPEPGIRDYLGPLSPKMLAVKQN